MNILRPPYMKVGVVLVNSTHLPVWFSFYKSSGTWVSAYVCFKKYSVLQLHWKIIFPIPCKVSCPYTHFVRECMRMGTRLCKEWENNFPTQLQYTVHASGLGPFTATHNAGSWHSFLYVCRNFVMFRLPYGRKLCGPWVSFSATVLPYHPSH